MKLKEISKDIYDVDAWLDEELGKEGTPEREASIEKAWEEYNGQILLDARKNARLTQEELANRIGADKSYISKIERGLITPTVSTLYRIAAAMGLSVELRPLYPRGARFFTSRASLHLNYQLWPVVYPIRNQHLYCYTYRFKHFAG